MEPYSVKDQYCDADGKFKQTVYAGAGCVGEARRALGNAGREGEPARLVAAVGSGILQESDCRLAIGRRRLGGTIGLRVARHLRAPLANTALELLGLHRADQAPWPKEH